MNDDILYIKTTFILVHPTPENLIAACSLLLNDKYYISPIAIFEEKRGEYKIRVPVRQDDVEYNKYIEEIFNELDFKKIAQFILEEFEKFYNAELNRKEGGLVLGDNVLMGFESIKKIRFQAPTEEWDDIKSLIKITPKSAFN